MTQARKTCLPDDEASGIQRFLYNTAAGRAVLKGILVRPWLSRLGGRYMSSRVSVLHIKPFIKSNNINMEAYLPEKYRSYNDFFTRRIRPGERPSDMSPEAFIAPCDSRMSAYRITPESTFCIKGGRYTIESMLGSAELAGKYGGGLCLIFRLAVDNYHRYCYIDNGKKSENRRLSGVYHTVHPIAHQVCDIYKQNTREYTILHTENFGDVIQVEVGALMVGRIRNLHQEAEIRKGAEKGRFEFGGSTIVLLIEKDRVILDEEFFINTNRGLETVTLMGERIGVRA